jgi:hypothetical protein
MAESRARDQIVIVTQLDDPHTDDVVTVLQDMGHEPVRLNTEDVPSNVTVSATLGADVGRWEAAIEIHTNGRRIDMDAIRSIWWRQPGEYLLPDDFSEQEREFAKDEIDHALRGLWASLDCYWISYPESIREASWKGSQLQRAAELGLDVPRTLVTTDPEAVRAFYDACDGQVCYKVLTDPFLGAPKVARKHPDREPPEPYQTPTTMITEAELELLDSVRLVPCLFQEYIAKQVELRVTVIGDEVFAAEIHSQEHKKTRIDWRGQYTGVRYAKAQLPAEVVERCLALVRSYNLNYGAMDFVLTPDGRYVFLENNPNGQFRFVELLVPELRLTAALASCLIRGANS